ncbi:hypothetical protein JG687_00001504 [Phytophthora cactorum]|uniref:Uncharacterized protein n=1 Tax=Phytophthora cactorum TaxID=29920 RepID=A0A8T1UXL6_9STRA|nr:hypothetical protein JG687_00001504 [Phytophthora cactorum]
MQEGVRDLLGGASHQWLRPSRPTSPCAAQISMAFTDPNSLKPRGKKRVRDLELKLKRLKLQNSSVVGVTKSELKPPPLEQNLVRREADQNSVWNGFAERQLKERLRLQKLLEKWNENQQDVGERVEFKQQQQQRFRDFKTDPEDEIYADQLALVTRMRLQTQKQSPGRTLYLSSGLSMGAEILKRDPSVKAGFILELQYGTMLPFGLEVAAHAFWWFFGCGYGMQRMDRNEGDLSTGTIAREFKIQTNFEDFRTKVGGKYTARRYMEEDGSIIIEWTGSGDVEEVNGVKFNDTHLHKQGCIKLRSVPRQGPGQESTSTILEGSFKTIPLFRESVVD